MNARILIPAIFGVAGCAVLISLGIWQVQRLAWKQQRLAQIQATIGADPVALPSSPDPLTDTYLPVQATGTLDASMIRILVSQKRIGAGYRLINRFGTEEGRVIMVDRGFVPVQQNDAPPPETSVTVTGNLHWPQEIDSFTPEPDIPANIWFARDVARMAGHLNTEPVLLIAREVPGDMSVTPLPVGPDGIPNDHLQYAITWFSLAAIWFGMTLSLLWRMTRRTV